jgi:hypothetical protein
MYTIKVTSAELIGIQVALNNDRRKLLESWLLSHEYNQSSQTYWAGEIQRNIDAGRKILDCEYSEVNN